MKNVSAFGLSLVAAAGLSSPLLASAEPGRTDIDHDASGMLGQVEYRELRVSVDSGIVRPSDADARSAPRSPQVPIWSDVIEVADAAWVRLRFGDVLLARSTEQVRESYLRITSLQDGHEQYLDAGSLRDWGGTTAYFNGGAVKVEIMASPNATHQINRVQIVGAQASAPSTGPRSICGSVDDRELSFDNRDARLMPIGCTAWVFSDHGSRMMTAAHCGPGAGDVIQFNVPLSSGGGSPQNPPPQDQYPVDPVSVQDSVGGVFIGNDWAYFGVFDNSNTDMSPGQTYGVWHDLAESPIAVDGRPIRITGYGSTSSPVPASWYLVQKTHLGPLVSISGNTVRYATDTTGGNSGSAILDEDNQQVLGVHTNAGCNSVGGNQGTSIFNNDLQNALDDPQGICVPRDIQASLVFEPTHIQPEGGDTVTLQIDNLQGHTVVGTPMMFVSADGGGFTPMAMTQTGSDTYAATFGSYYCGASVDYYFEIIDEEDTVVSVPSSGTFSTVALDELTIAFEDTFETDQDWLSYTTGGSASWLRTIPADYGLGDPEGDADGSGKCYVTGNSNGLDVDNGSVVLLSPLMDLTAIDEPALRMAAWMTGSGPDSLRIEFTDNAGITWTTVDSFTNLDGWENLSYNLADHVSLNNAFRMRVTATDAGADTLVEAGIDAFKISSEICEGGGCPADLTGDGELDFFDVNLFVSAFHDMDPSADFTGDGDFDFFDVADFIDAFDAGCP